MRRRLNTNLAGWISQERSFTRFRHRLVAATLIGGLSGLAFAPFFLFPFAYIGLYTLAILIRRSRNAPAAFLVGWAFGLGQFVVGLSWITESFAVEAEKFSMLAWPSVIALSAFLAVFPALAAMAARYLGGPSLRTFIILPATWAVAEMARGVILTGFPWNLIGYIWGFSDQVLQGVSVMGIYGLGFLTILMATMPLLISEKYELNRLSAALVMILAPSLSFVVLWAGGAMRLAATDVAEDGQHVRIVQPNIPQSQKWEANQAQAILGKLLALSTSGEGDRPRFVIWPETAYPILFEAGRNVPPALMASVPPGGLLLFGAVREAPARPPNDPGLLNSVVALDDEGIVVADYDKVRLVPFGEFTPFRNVLGAMKMTVGDIDYVPGGNTVPMRLVGLPAARALICYEAVFPRSGSDGERWILNITNDAWFGMSAGPYQHFLAARVRAIEAGLPLVRAANSGISGIVDGYGRVMNMLPLDVSGVIDGLLPAATTSETVFARFGNVPVVVMIVLLFVAGTGTRRGSRGTEQNDFRIQ